MARVQNPSISASATRRRLSLAFLMALRRARFSTNATSARVRLPRHGGEPCDLESTRTKIAHGRVEDVLLGTGGDETHQKRSSLSGTGAWTVEEENHTTTVALVECAAQVSTEI